MASSSTLNEANDKPASPIMTSPGVFSKQELQGLILTPDWVIGESISKENERHAAVYSVVVIETDQLAEDLEAHVFSLIDVPQKLRKHQQRCIRRMGARTKLKLEVLGLTIVVIATSQSETTSILGLGKEPHSVNKSDQYETDSVITPIEEVKKQPRHHQELERTRQRERRQAKRRAKAAQSDERTADSGNMTSQNVDHYSSSVGKNESSMFVALIHDLLDYWDLCTEIPALYNSLTKNIQGGGDYERLDKYLSQTDALLQRVEEIESYLKIKRREVVSRRVTVVLKTWADIHILDELLKNKRHRAEQKASLALRRNVEFDPVW